MADCVRRGPSIFRIGMLALAIVMLGDPRGAWPGNLDPPRRVVLRVKPALAATARRSVARSATTLGHPGLDRLNQRFRVTTVTPLVPEEATVSRQPRSGRQSAGPPVTLDGVFVLELPPGSDAERASRAYAGIDGVVWAEPEMPYEADYVPNDPYYASSGAWGQPYDDLWGLDKIDAATAWDVTRGAGVVVAILDTGVDGAHPDLAGQMWANPAEIAGNGADDDHNGFIDDFKGWDFVSNDADPFDDHGHGTHVAGTVAAAGDNGLGVVGVAWQAVVMPVKVLGFSGSGSHVAVAQGIAYAVANGADVINASLGGGYSQLIADAVAAAYAAGVVFVAAAGNGAADVVASGHCPACLPEAISVAASNSDDLRAYFSNTGKIDVAAPGGGDACATCPVLPSVSILSTRSSGAHFDPRLDVGSGYLRLQGTSMAAPHVAGAAALVLALHPDYTVEEVRQLLRATADDLGLPGVDESFGYGRLNVGRAAYREHPLEVRILSPVTGSTVNDVVTIVATAAGETFGSFVLQWGVGTVPTSWTTIAGPVVTPVHDAPIGAFDPTGLPDGSYTLRLLAQDTSGQAYEDRSAIALDHVTLTAPQSNDVVGAGSAPVEIRGEVGGVGFDHFTVEYRVVGADLVEGAWRTDGVTLGGGGTMPLEGVLAELDPTAVGGSSSTDLRMTIYYSDGRPAVTESVQNVVVDATLRLASSRRFPINRFIPCREHTTLADLDGDGSLEILAAYDDLAWVVRADGSDAAGWPQAVAPTLPPALTYANGAPAAADLDGDGQLEVIVGVRSRDRNYNDLSHESIMVWHADGTPLSGWPFTGLGSFLEREADLNPLTLVTGIAATDVDGDGAPEVVAQWRQRLHVLRADGTSLAGFPRIAIGDFATYDASFEGAPAVGDMDGDGTKEIVVAERRWYFRSRRAKQYLHVFRADGSEVHGWPRRISNRTTLADPSPVLADLDGDGRLDVGIDSERPTASIAFTASGKRLHLKPSRVPIWLPNPKWFSGLQGALAAGDLDGDGKADLLVPSGTVGRPEVLVENGFFTLDDFLTVLRVGGLPGWTVRYREHVATFRGIPGPAVIGDLDGNGSQDVVEALSRCAGNGGVERCFTIHAYTSMGSPIPGFPKVTPGPATVYGDLRPGTVSPALGDLDGDGREELVFIDILGNLMVWNLPGTSGPRQREWPMIRHDAGHTGTLPVGH